MNAIRRFRTIKAIAHSLDLTNRSLVNMRMQKWASLRTFHSQGERDSTDKRLKITERGRHHD